MSVGLPGTGVGGLFYLLSGLFMPFREAYRAMRGRSSRNSRRLVMRLVAITLGVLGGIWVTGWFLGLVLSQVPPVAALLQGVRVPAARVSNVLRIASFFIAFGTLAGVLGAVELARVVRAWSRGHTEQRVPDPPRCAEREAA